MRLALVALAALLGGSPRQDADALYKTFIGEFIAVTPGEGTFPKSFTMGSSFEGALAAEKPAREVTLTRTFRMNKYEVPQNLWEAVTGANPSRWTGKRNSVEMLTVEDAVAFCKKITATLREKKLIDAKESVRLPTEAEWEYCCRAGTATRWGFGDDEKDLGDYGWFDGNAARNDPPVGQKKANAWGFHDMHGYLWEFCSDEWIANYSGGAPDPKARVARGGAWTSKADLTRSASRARVALDHKAADLGLRCVIAAE